MSDHATLRAKVEAMAIGKPIQILVNNTGGPPGGQAQSAKVEEFLTAFGQHLIANQIVLQAVLPGMRGSGYGRVINTASQLAHKPAPHRVRLADHQGPLVAHDTLPRFGDHAPTKSGRASATV
jgi:NADP-dependent 3-hydroxy acid dehydrogenase YdfG